MEKDDVIFKIIVDEISGKNQAIHAYDRMIWMIRSGFITLFFAGWGIIFKSIIDNPSQSQTNIHRVLIAMALISVALSLGASILDRNYVKRKFRVIYTLDALMSCVMLRDVKLFANMSEIINYMQVSGDKDDTFYREVSGYPHECYAGFVIYLVPIIMIIAGVMLVW
jgi:hypothetical protein